VRQAVNSQNHQMVAHALKPLKVNPMVLFVALQVLDLTSTIIFLHTGVREANPIVRCSMSMFGGALPGLLVIKILAAVLGLACYGMKRFDFLRRANISFVILILWNSMAIFDATLIRGAGRF
jgi:hypothetical protein